MDNKKNIIVYNCELYKVEIININYEYNAISYRWGHIKDTWFIDTPYGETEIKSIPKYNWDFFVRETCKHTKTKYIWIDCISINQNLKDKSDFLITMPEIYKKAKHVIAAPWISYEFIKNIESKHLVLKKKQINLYFEWINRSWVAQEINLAQKILFTLPNYDIDIDNELSRNGELCKLSNERLDCLWKEFIKREKMIDIKKLQKIYNIMEYNNKLFVIRLFKNATGITLSQKKQYRKICSFIDRLTMLRNIEKENWDLKKLIRLIIETESTIEMDKIYALLPLTNLKINKHKIYKYKTINITMKEIIKEYPKLLIQIIMSTYICKQSPTWLFENKIIYYNTQISIPVEEEIKFNFKYLDKETLKIDAFILLIDDIIEMNTKENNCYTSKILINKTILKIKHGLHVEGIIKNKKNYLFKCGKDENNNIVGLILNKNDDYYVKIGLFSITIDYENFLIWKKENINIK